MYFNALIYFIQYSGTNDLCVLEPKLGVRPNPNCVPLEKVFYLQYQWMAFLVASLAILYYLPYVMYCKVSNYTLLYKKLTVRNRVLKSPDSI